MSDDLQTISTIATSVSAVAAAAAAIANWRNTSTFVRQLRNTTVDASLTAAFAFQAAVHKTIEFRENQMKGVDNITPEKTLAAYGDAWPRWEAFHQAYRIAQRYRKDLSPGLKDLKSPPDRHVTYFQNCGSVYATTRGPLEEITILRIFGKRWTR
jgi:hypothetical protein